MRDLLDPTPETLSDPSPARLTRTALVTVLGFALYGFTVGFWRSPMMGGFVAVKMPLLIALTLLANGMLNGMLGLLLGSRLGFAQSLLALLSAFSISALILGSIAPVTLFMALNAPAPDSPDAAMAHSTYQLAHTTLIAIAGLAGVLRLRNLLMQWCANAKIAKTTLTAWIIGNAFLGAQFSWILRPFFGAPHLDVAFLREEPMKGSFYVTLWGAAKGILSQADPGTIILAVMVGLILLALVSALFQQKKPIQTIRP